jgi:DNA-binding MarR family transcriptional regulator
MAKGKKEPIKSAKRLTGNAKYLEAMFSLLKKREGVVVSDKNNKFNDTELRMLGEILAAKHEGRRLISTQLATLLGITRSAVSQIVNRLEMQGFVQRVPDAVDKKIAYIEITEETKATYGKDLDICLAFIGKAVEKFGEANFEKMYALMCGFIDVLEELRADWQD